MILHVLSRLIAIKPLIYLLIYNISLICEQQFLKDGSRCKSVDNLFITVLLILFTDLDVTPVFRSSSIRVMTSQVNAIPNGRLTYKPTIRINVGKNILSEKE